MIVSIITPSFNQGQFIEDTIKSVLEQKGNFYIDYIIQDGGSNDETVKIIKKYENLLKKNCKIKKIKGLEFYIKRNKNFRFNNCLGISYRWESKKDNGQVDALKKGFRKAIGDIYAWLNSDDFYLNKNVLEKVALYFKKDKNLKILTADGIFTDKEGKKTGVHHVSRINFKELLYLDYHILQPSTFVKSEIHKNEYLDESYRVAFDCYYFIKLLSLGYEYKKTNDLFSAFRFYQENKTLGLANIGFKEQMRIAWHFSKNIFYFLISYIYRYFEKNFYPKYKNTLFFQKIFLRLQNFSYRIIINEKYEERTK